MGIFEIVEPVLEGDEVFDSNLLKQTIESMIAAGRRNIAVDLSQLDYLYSDAINALVVMNKRMLDVFGRLALLAPQPEVLEILKKGGIQNIVKIFSDEPEIIQLSQQMTGQSMPAAAPVFQAPPQQPQSEFDNLRSEIGSAFDGGAGAAGGMPGMMPPPQAPQQYAQQPFAAGGFQPQPPRPAQPAMPSQRPPFMTPPKPSFAPPPPAAGGAPRFPAPPRGFEPIPQKPPARAFTPPPPKPAAAPHIPGGETRRMPPVPEPPVSFQQQIQPQPEEDLEKIEASLEKKMPALEKEKFDVEAAEIAPKKRSLVPMLAALMVLIVAGVGGYFAYINFLQKPGTSPASTSVRVEPQPPAVPPQVPVPVEEKPVPEEPVAEIPVEPTKPEIKKVQPSQASTPAPVKKTVAAAPVRRPPPPAPKPVVREPPAPVVKPVVRETTPVKPVATVEKPKIEVPPEPVAVEPPKQVVSTPPPPVVTAPPPPPPPAPEPPPAQEPAAGGTEETTIFVGTIPPLADVYMDGKFIGKNSAPLKVAPGTHVLRFVKGDKEVSKQFTFQPGKNPGTFLKIQ